MKLHINTNRVVDRTRKQREEKKSGGGNDDRFVPYYKLEKGEELAIRLLPVAEDIPEESISWESHGPMMKSRDIPPVQCLYVASKKNCPICKKGFQLKEDGDPISKKFMRKSYTLAQCLVIEAPEGFEIPETEDGNPVKLIYLPIVVKELIDESLANQEIEDLNSVNLVIKKSEKKGRPSYHRSYFEDAEELSEEVKELFDDGTAYLHDISDVVHPLPTAEEAKEWVKNALAVLTEDEEDEEEEEKPRRSRTSSKREEKDDDDDDEEEKSTRKSSTRTRRASKEDDVDDDDDEPKSKSSVLDKYSNRRRTRSKD